jgi:hypothetical protein
MLSYSSILSYPKATLPSVEMWNTNMNILKDPPKAIHTRRIDKVGDTQQVLLQAEDSGSRFNEYINVYARNTNPMVGVSYNNYGNSQSSSNSRTQASLPYKVKEFRPPILSQYDLLPLSRLPRDWFYASTNPEFPQIVQNLQCNETGRCIQNDHRSGSDIHVDSQKKQHSNIDTFTEKNRDWNTLKTRNKTLLEHPSITNKSFFEKNDHHTQLDKKSIKEIINHYNIDSQKKIIANDQILDPLKKLWTKKQNTAMPSLLNKSQNRHILSSSSYLSSSHKQNEKSLKNRSMPFTSNIVSNQIKIQQTPSQLELRKKMNEKALKNKSISFQGNLTKSNLMNTITPPQHISYPFQNKDTISISTQKNMKLPSSSNDYDLSKIRTKNTLIASGVTNTKLSHLGQIYHDNNLPELDSKLPHYEFTSNFSSYEKNQKPMDQKLLQRRLPISENVDTNKIFAFETFDNQNMTRDVQLQERLNIGGFENQGSGIPNPKGIQDKYISGITIDHSKSSLKQNMKNYVKDLN